MADWVMLPVVTGGIGGPFKSVTFFMGIEGVWGWPALCGGLGVVESGFTGRGCGEEKTRTWLTGSA